MALVQLVLAVEIQNQRGSFVQNMKERLVLALVVEMLVLELVLEEEQLP